MFVSAIIVAGGRGTRLGGAVPKQLLDLGGRTMLQRSVDAFDVHPGISEIVVVLPRELADGQVAVEAPHKPLRVVAGGERRQDSMAAGFGAASQTADIVLVHDAARPFVSGALISRVVDGAKQYGAAIPARQPSETVKRAARAGAKIDATVPRETVWLAQTPQGFQRDVLVHALSGASGAGAPFQATDEAMLAERAGYSVHIVEGDADNVKITTERDLVMARRHIGDGVRVGTGYDLHRLVDGRTLVLAGIEIPFDKGPLGHSDGDVAAHALCDAIFGAAAMGDIGRHFPNTDPEWKDAAGVDLLARSAAIAAGGGWRVVSADVTVILERPKLAPFIERIRDALAGALGIPSSSVSVKAKTNEGVDAVGRGEALAAHAVAVLRRDARAERGEA